MTPNLIKAAKQALGALWDCTLKLESQQFRNPVQIPPIYTDIIRSGYAAHANLRAEIAEWHEQGYWNPEIVQIAQENAQLRTEVAELRKLLADVRADLVLRAETDPEDGGAVLNISNGLLRRIDTITGEHKL